MFISSRNFVLFILVNCLNVYGKGFQHNFYNNTHKQERTVRSSECRTTDRLHGICMPITYCFNQYENMSLILENSCLRAEHDPGVCCPHYGLEREPALKKNCIKVPSTKTRINFNVKVNNRLLEQAIDAAINEVNKQLNHEKNLIKAGIHQHNNTMESFHQGFFGPYDNHRKEVTRSGKYILETSRQLARILKLKPKATNEVLSRYCLKDTKLSGKCLKAPNCSPETKYRTLDGSCNNLKYPLWGRTMTRLSRLLPPEYSDGIDEFRKSVSGIELPNARYLSTQLTSNEESDHSELSVMFLQFGQFVDHDMALGLNTRADSGEGLSCCTRNANGEYVKHQACRPIMTPSNDPFYARYNQTCSNFVRQAAAPSLSCTLGPREQTNAVTHFIDGSHIYGSDWDRMSTVRSYREGKLHVSKLQGKDFLPIDEKDLSVVCTVPKDQKCIYSGDIRANQQLGLTVLHLMFMREHNRIAGILKQINPEWNDETLFQETRRIIGAQLQWITYNEFLPLALGRRVMRTFEISPSPWGYSFSYHPNINPGILNEFSSAAFRWHTLVMNSYNLIDAYGDYTKYYKLSSVFNDPTPLYSPGAVDEVLFGTVLQPSQTFDTKFVAEITQQLFATPGSPFGGDLVAINIQRGRDNGLPPYNKFREICGLPKIKSFNDLNKYFRIGSAKLFERVYRSVDDIDLFMGGVHEKPLPEGIVGPVFACIVAEQFRRTKLGDRYWFENYGFSHSFTEAQINEIKKVSLSGIFCANGDNVKHYPPLALLQPTDGNELQECTKLLQMDLRQWKTKH